VPLITPAKSGLALLNGMFLTDCNLTIQFGMTNYRRRTEPQLSADLMPVTLCSRANAKGFSRVVVLDGSPGLPITVNAIECPTESHRQFRAPDCIL
jgi:hypothetical protein